MALSDPFPTNFGGTPTITVAGGASKPLPRTGSGELKSIYRLEEAGNVSTTLEVSHSPDLKKPRAVVRLVRSSLVANPLLTGQSRPAEIAVTLTANWDPLAGIGEVQAVYNQLLSLLSSATLLKVVGGET